MSSLAARQGFEGFRDLTGRVMGFRPHTSFLARAMTMDVGDDLSATLARVSHVEAPLDLVHAGKLGA